MNLDIGRSVTFPFEDKRWANKLIAFLVIGFVPGLNLILWSGYAISIARNMARGEKDPLPGWETWSDIAVRGLLAIMAQIVYFGPALLVICCIVAASALLGGRGESFFAPLRCIGWGLAILYTLTINYVLHSGHLRFAQYDQFFRYLDFGGRLNDVRMHTGLFGMLFAYQTLLSFVVILLTIVALMLSLVAFSAIWTVGGVLAIGIVFLLALALLGYVAFVTMAFLANGYLLGSALLSVVSSS